MAAYPNVLVFAARAFAQSPTDANFWRLAELCDKHPRAPAVIPEPYTVAAIREIADTLAAKVNGQIVAALAAASKPRKRVVKTRNKPGMCSYPKCARHVPPSYIRRGLTMCKQHQPFPA